MLVAAYYNVLFKKHAAIFTKTVESSDSQIYNKSRLAASTTLENQTCCKNTHFCPLYQHANRVQHGFSVL